MAPIKSFGGIIRRLVLMVFLGLAIPSKSYQLLLIK
jgi:hypothetical protein